MVLPLTAKINKLNHLEIGGCDTVALAQEFGTPLFVFDEETVRQQCRNYLKWFSQSELEVEVIYASKAFVCLALCKVIKEEGLSLDVSSGGELFTAYKAGFPLEKVYLHGNNKTEEELNLALDLGVGCIVVDSFDEINLLERLALVKAKTPRILLRITPGVRSHTHEFLETGEVDSKFGFGLEDGSALAAVKRVLESKNLHLTGLHIHIGSQIYALHSYSRAIEVIMDFSHQIQEETGFSVKELNLGGGLGIKYEATDQPSTIEDYAKVVLGGVTAKARELNLPLPKVMIEPGRSIVGNAGITLYRIGTIKKIPGVRTYISVDGGMSDNLRPLLYGAVYEAILANKAGEPKSEKVTIAGKHCESGDILIKEALLPKASVGDLLCTPATGAYGYVLANNYNKQPKPAVVMVKKGKAKIIIRRETYEDLIRLEASYEKDN